MKAIILCGGKGERIRPLSDFTPKPLIKLSGKPILEYIIRHLESYGVDEIIVTTGYKASLFDEYLLDNEFSIKISTVDSGDADILKRLEDATTSFDGPFLLVYGDTLSDINIDKLREFHKKQNRMSTITVFPLYSEFGVVDFDENLAVSDFLEKPKLDRWINIGYFIFESNVKTLFSKFDKFEQLLEYLSRNASMSAFRHTGEHLTVNTQKQLHYAERNLSKIGKKYVAKMEK